MRSDSQAALLTTIIKASEADGLRLATRIDVLLQEPDLPAPGIHFDPRTDSAS